MSARERCTCGETACESELCDCDARPCPVDHAAEEQRSAREKILRFAEENHSMIDHWTDPETGFFVGDPQAHLGQLLDAYAHGLAEKIRNEPSPRDPDDYYGLVDQGANWAADLIDPEVSNGG